MNNLIARTLTLSGDYQAFASSRLPASGLFYPLPENQGTVYIAGDDGSDVPVPALGFAVFDVNLQDFRFKGSTSGDGVVFLGGTW